MKQLHSALGVTPAQCSDLDPGISEATLVQNAQAGDAESLECLLRRHRPSFCRRAQRTCGDPTAAEDICQEVCLKVIHCLSRFVPSRSFRAWVFGIIDNEARHWQRDFKKVCTRREEIGNHILETMSAGADNKSEADEREFLSFLSRRAAHLAPPQRPSAMFMLAHYERLHELPTVRAIAQATHSSHGAAQLNRQAVLACWQHILTASELELPTAKEPIMNPVQMFEAKGVHSPCSAFAIRHLQFAI